MPWCAGVAAAAASKPRKAAAPATAAAAPLSTERRLVDALMVTCRSWTTEVNAGHRRPEMRASGSVIPSGGRWNSVSIGAARRQAATATVGALGVLYAGYVGWFLSSWGGDGLRTAVSDAIYVPFCLTFTVFGIL